MGVIYIIFSMTILTLSVYHLLNREYSIMKSAEALRQAVLNFNKHAYSKTS